MKDIKITFSDVAYVYFHDLPPEGIIEVNRTTYYLRQVKQNDFYVYFYTQLDPADEFRAFKKWIDVLSMQYNRFVFIGYQYGALFSLYFSSKIENSFSVSLDGTELIETTQHIAYDVLKLDKNKPIVYMQDKAVCDGHDLYKEWREKNCV